jgi:hypothetical protein
LLLTPVQQQSRQQAEAITIAAAKGSGQTHRQQSSASLAPGPMKLLENGYHSQARLGLGCLGHSV